ncbi:hypothetical protein GOP47_0028757 [Adiantum capillus-veneris]|nr:hypothetical protein GOP47_0028757 [Adiantum capillus-veneris]
MQESSTNISKLNSGESSLNVSSPRVSSDPRAHALPDAGTNHGSSQGSPGSNKQAMCLCAPTTHAGSFRCRFHRSASFKKWEKVTSPTDATSTEAATVEAQ